MHDLIFWIHIIILACTSVTGILKFNTLAAAFRVLVILVITTMIFDLSLHFIGPYQKTPLINYSNTPLHFILLCTFYFKTFTSKLNKQITIAFLATFLSTCLINFFFTYSKNIFPIYPMLLESIFLVILTFLSFYDIYISSKYESLLKSSMFWLNNSLLIFYSAGFIFYGFLTYDIGNAMESKFIIYSFTPFFQWLFVLMNCLVLVSIILDKRKRIHGY